MVLENLLPLMRRHDVAGGQSLLVRSQSFSDGDFAGIASLMGRCLRALPALFPWFMVAIKSSCGRVGAIIMPALQSSFATSDRDR